MRYHQPPGYKVIWFWENDVQVMKKKGGTKILKTEAEHELELLQQAKDRTGKAP